MSAASVDGSSPLQDIRILIVDSDPPSARLLQAVLEQEGCVFQVATQGAEALTAVSEFGPNLVLLELVLPDMPGLDLVRALKASPAASNVVMLAVTASNGPETRRLALEAGCVDYVRKPIDALSFTARLAMHLGKHVESAGATNPRGSESR